MIHERQEVQDVLKKLQNLLFDFVIAGGYPRDLALGRQPKDVDICIYNYHPEDAAEMKFTEMLYSWLKEKGLIKTVHDEDEQLSYDDARIHRVWSLNCDVDIIFWNAANEWEVLRNFDFNINQYIWDATRQLPMFVGNLPEKGTLTMLRDLWDYNQDPTERILKMCAIADEVGWDTTKVKADLKRLLETEQ